MVAIGTIHGFQVFDAFGIQRMCVNIPRAYSRPICMRWSPDNTKLAIATDSTITMFTKRGQLDWSAPRLAQRSFAPHGIVWNPDGDWFILVHLVHRDPPTLTFESWSVDGGPILKTMTPAVATTLADSIKPQLVDMAAGQIGPRKIAPTKTMVAVRAKLGRKHATLALVKPTSVHNIREQDILYEACAANNVKIDSALYAYLRSLKHSSGINWSPTGNHLVTATANTACVWTKSLKLVKMVEGAKGEDSLDGLDGLDGVITRVKWSIDGTRVAIFGSVGRVFMIRTTDQKKEKGGPTLHEAESVAP